VTESRISQIRTTAMLHLRATLQPLTQGVYAPVGSPIPMCPPQQGAVSSRCPTAP